MKSIAILLTTFNSGAYLPQLLDSLIGQTYQNWALYIRDDGSTDNTLKIVEDYNANNKNIIYVTDKEKGRGAKNSFMWLLNNAEASYYMFCDHDDVWLPNKIEKTYLKMLEVESSITNVPVVIHTDLLVVDEKLNEIAPSFWKYANINPNFSSFNFYTAYNNVTGCTMMINENAKGISLNMPSCATMHDAWISTVVSFNKGVIAYIADPLILYRQHPNNTIGAKQGTTLYDSFFNFKAIVISNKKLFKTINYLQKTSIVFFIINKIYYKYLSLRYRY